MNNTMEMLIAIALISLSIVANAHVANPVEYDRKESYKLNNKTVVKVKCLTKDHIAVEEEINYRTDWKILERSSDSQTMLSHIASHWKHQR